MGSQTKIASSGAAACLVIGAALFAVSGCALREGEVREPAPSPRSSIAEPAASVAVPEAQVLEAEAEARVADGDLLGAITLLERAIALRESVPEHDRLEVAETLERLADLLEAIDRPARSSSLTERALEIRTAAEHVPGDAARVLAGLAWVQQQRGRPDAAESLVRRALARLDERGPDGPPGEASELPDRALRARLHARLGALQRALGREDEALESLAFATGLLDGARPEEQLLRAHVARETAAIHVARDRYDAALQQLAHALSSYSQFLPDDDALVGDTSARVALVSLLRGDFRNALILFDRAIAIAEAQPEPDPATLAALHRHRTRGELVRASAQFAQDLGEPACASYRDIVARLEAENTADAANLAFGIAGLAECAWREDRRDDAEALYARSVRALEPDETPEPALLGSLHAGLATLRASAGRHEDALVSYERALAAYETDPDAPPAAVAQVLYQAGHSALALSRRPEALVHYVRALSLREQALPGDHPDLARSLDSVGAMLLERGDLEGARPLLERAVAIHEQGVTRPVELGASLSYLGRVQAKQGDGEVARQTLARSVALLEAALGKLDPLTLATRAGLENLRFPLPADRAP